MPHQVLARRRKRETPIQKKSPPKVWKDKSLPKAPSCGSGSRATGLRQLHQKTCRAFLKTLPHAQALLRMRARVSGAPQKRPTKAALAPMFLLLLAKTAASAFFLNRQSG